MQADQRLLAGVTVANPPSPSDDARSAVFSQSRLVSELRPHPALAKHARGYETHQLSILSQRGESVYSEPITITHENLIVEGYAVWQLANLQKRQTLLCVVRELDQEEALLYLLNSNRGSKGIRDFSRILMALELEPWFRDRAKGNQRIGGRDKGSTQLAEAERLDVRIEVARAAGVSAGNVSKVKHILQCAIPEVRDALLSGEIRINRGACWSKCASSVQASQLSAFRNEHGIRLKIAVLLRRHVKSRPALCEGLHDIQRGLHAFHADPNLYPLMAKLRILIDDLDDLLRGTEVNRAA